MNRRLGLSALIIVALAAAIGAERASAERPQPSADEIASMRRALDCAAMDADRIDGAVRLHPAPRGALLVELLCEIFAYNATTAYFLYEAVPDADARWTPISFAVIAPDGAVAMEPTLFGGRFDAQSGRFEGYYKSLGWGGCGRRTEHRFDGSAQAPLARQWEWDFCAADADLEAFERRMADDFDSFLIFDASAGLRR